MLKYDLKKNILSYKFMLYVLSILMLVFIIAFISDGSPDIDSFSMYIELQWKSILLYMFPILSALYVSDTIHNEFESGQTKYTLLHIHSKKKWFFYKLFMTITVSVVMLVVVIISSLATFILWHSRMIRFIDLLDAIIFIMNILLYLIPIELVFTYIANRGVNVVPVMLTVYLVFMVIDTLFTQMFFTPTSLLSKNYSYKPFVFIVYVLVGLYANIKHILRKDYDL